MMIHPTGPRGIPFRKRSALTVVEVLFALSIILVGLIGIAAMVPFAARQANESYSTVQSVVAGDSAAAMAESQAVFKPTSEKPWQIIDDEVAAFGDSNETYFYSFEELYNNNGRKGNPIRLLPSNVENPKYQYDLLSKNLDLLNFDALGSTQAMEDAAWLAVNRTLGTSFYMDPSFWGSQDFGAKVMRDDWFPFRRSRFPYYADGFGPTTPRALRVSLRDISHIGANGGWIKQPTARSTMTPGGDIVSIKPESSRSFATRRQVMVTPEPRTPSDLNSSVPIQSIVTPNAPIWSALITPAESTPILEKSKLPSRTTYATTADYALEMRKYVIPMSVEAYDLSIVVQKKRPLREIYQPLVQTPETVEGERIFGVSWVTTIDEPKQSGTFEITLTQPPAITAPMEAKLKAGDWLMLSRNVLHFYRNAANVPAAAVMRQKHKWYRVVSAPSADSFLPNPATGKSELSVRISGGAWTWTTDEIQSASRAGLILSNISVGDTTTSYYQETSATLVPNVVHVFERTMTVSN